MDAIPYIIRNEKNGLLVNVDDADGASDAVLRIYQKNELKNKFVTQGLKDVHDRFDARRVSEQHGMLFENMIR